MGSYGTYLCFFGILSVLFALIAIFNVLKHHVKSHMIKSICKHHEIFGQAAVIFALTHMVFAIINHRF